MFCKYCGTETADDAQFCPKCGKSTGTQVMQSKAAIPQQKTPSGINLKILIPLIAVIAVLSVVIIIKFIGNIRSDTTSNSVASVDLPVEEDVECSGCADAIACYDELMNSSNAYGQDMDEIAIITAQYYNAMHHDCNANTVVVENVPYSYRGYTGTYSGEWKGAGPFGVGQFIGKAKFKDNDVVYSGEWAYGLPEGQGDLYIENFVDSGWDMRYSGFMQAGMRNGDGYMFEYNRGGAYNPMYRIYDAVTFQNDIMTSVVDCAQYDAETGEILYYYRLTGDDSGFVTMLDSWGANELNPEQRKLLEIGECALVAGTLAYMMHSAYKGFTWKPDSQSTTDQELYEIKTELSNLRYQAGIEPLW